MRWCRRTASPYITQPSNSFVTSDTDAFSSDFKRKARREQLFCQTQQHRLNGEGKDSFIYLFISIFYSCRWIYIHDGFTAGEQITSLEISTYRDEAESAEFADSKTWRGGGGKHGRSPLEEEEAFPIYNAARRSEPIGIQAAV